MTNRTVIHATFVIERDFAASPARVFNAWADPEIKRRWFSGPEDWSDSAHELDFREGGREVSIGRPPGGPLSRMDAIHMDLVPNERIITAYEMHLDDARISVSLGTTELRPHGTGTRLAYTEQGAFLDGFDNPELREQGMGWAFDALEAELKSQDP